MAVHITWLGPLLLAMAVTATSPLPRVNLTLIDGGAKCLDGTAYAYFLRKSSTGSKKWVLFLEGGGLCVEPVDCAKRKKSSLGSSDYFPQAFQPGTDGGVDILSDDAKINPSFHEYNHVWLPYCSGDTWTGTRTKPTEDGFQFSGHINIKAVVAHLNETQGLGQSATHVLLMGSSAGGIGTFNNIDYLREEWLPDRNIVVKGHPVSGFYFPSPVVLYPEWRVGLNESIDPLASMYLVEWFDSALDGSCTKEHPYPHKHLCWDAHIHYKYISTPIFVTENRFDQNQINSVLLCPKENNVHTTAFIRDFGGRMEVGLRNTVQSNAGKAKGDGLFSPSCFSHTVDICVQGGPELLSPSGKVVRMMDLFVPWWEQGGSDTFKYQLVDTCSGLDPCGNHCKC